MLYDKDIFTGDAPHNVVIDDSIYEENDGKDPYAGYGMDSLRFNGAGRSNPIAKALKVPVSYNRRYHVVGIEDNPKACFVYPMTGGKTIVDYLLPCAKLELVDGSVHTIVWIRPGDTNDGNETMFNTTFDTVEEAYQWIDSGRAWSNPVNAKTKVKQEEF